MYVCTIWFSWVLTCMLSNEFFHNLHLQNISSHDFTSRLKESKIGDDFKWDGILGVDVLQILEPETLLRPYFT